MSRIKFRNVAGTLESFLQNLATGIRTWTMPDKNGTVAMTDDVTDAVDALAATIPPMVVGAVTDANLYSDYLFNNSPWKMAVEAATTIALPLNTMVGDIIEADADGVLPTIDGLNPDLFIVKNEGDHKKHGIFIKIAPGSVSTPWQIQRHPTLLDSAVVLVRGGTLNAGKRYRQLTPNPVLGTDNIEWTEELLYGEPEDTATGVIKFDKPRHYGEAAPISAAALTLDTTNFKRGCTQIVRHNAGAEPTYVAAFKKLGGSGDYVPSVDNIITFYPFTQAIIYYAIDQA